MSSPQQALPVDRTRQFHPSLYPNDPDTYDEHAHFEDRKSEPVRHLTMEIEGEPAYEYIVKNGDLSDNGDGCGVFVYYHHGVQYYIVVGFHDAGHRMYVSGWPMLRNDVEAVASGAWTEQQVEEIRRFNTQHFNGN